MFRARFLDHSVQRPKWFFSPDGSRWLSTEDSVPNEDDVNELCERYHSAGPSQLHDREFLAAHRARIEPLGAVFD